MISTVRCTIAFHFAWLILGVVALTT
ncbi:MAG: hypothetical protein JWN70_2147, partial [Planctomycetaceae bacterium]|nr:hypothetical protein [Planctomycetaceae bacterium]